MARKEKYTFYVIEHKNVNVNADNEVVNPSYDERMTNTIASIEGKEQKFFLVELCRKVATITGNTLAEIQDKSFKCADENDLYIYSCYRVKK